MYETFLGRAVRILAAAAMAIPTALFAFDDGFMGTATSVSAVPTVSSGPIVQEWTPELPESVIAELRSGDLAKYSPPFVTLSNCEDARDRNALEMPWLARTDCFLYKKTYRYYTHAVRATDAVSAELEFFGIRAGLRPNPEDIRNRIKESRGWNDACVTRKGKKKLDAQLSGIFRKMGGFSLESNLDTVSGLLDKYTMDRFAGEKYVTNPVGACSAEYLIARLEAKKGLILRNISKKNGVGSVPMVNIPSASSPVQNRGSGSAQTGSTAQEPALDESFADLLGNP